jgi:MFS family permease
MKIRAGLRELTLMSASSITIIGTTAIAASLPEMLKRFAHTPHAQFLVGLTLTLPALGAGVCAPVMGAIVDRSGRKRLFLIALAGYGMAGCAGAFLENLYAIMVSRFVLGIAVSGVATCATVLISDYSRQGGLGKLMGRQSLFMALGNVLFVFTGGLLALAGWHWPFMIYSVGLLLIPAVAVLIDEPRTAPSGAAPASAVGPPQQTRPGPMRWGAMGWVYFLLFLNMVIYFMVPVHLPFYLDQFTRGGSAQAGALLSLVGLTWAASSTLYERLERRRTHEQIFVLTFAGSAVANVVLGLASGYSMVVPALVLLGASLGLSITNLNTWLFALARVRAKGRVIGTRVFFTFIGQFFSPVLTSPLTSALGFGPGYVVAGCVLAALVIGTQIHLLTRRSPTQPKARTMTTNDRSRHVGTS